MEFLASSQHGDKFDHGVMDRFLNLSELPVIGTSALEQILHQASLDFSSSASPSSSTMSSMSPDSTTSSFSGGRNSTSGIESGSESEYILPDSTTDNKDEESDNCSVNSDPINSSSSEYSFAASPPSFEPILQEDQSPVNSSPHSLKRKGDSVDCTDCTEEETTEEARPISKKRARKSKAGPCELSCPLCEYKTRVKEHLASHMNSHTQDRKYMCVQCGQTFKWSHSLRRHQRTHQKDYKFTCAHCPKQFSRKDHLAVHEKLHDSDSAESYPCPECGVKFKNKKTLTGHIKTHSTDKPHKCDSCDSAFTRKASLTRHVLAAHAGHVFHCDVCSAPFSYRSTLEDHRRAVHNEGKRDFHCTGCRLSFACKAYLQKHLGVCKNRADKQEVLCSECGKSFPSRRHLQEHRRNKHRDAMTPNSPAFPIVNQQLSYLSPQNMGHNIGQYFNLRVGAKVLPSYHQTPLYHPVGYRQAPVDLQSPLSELQGPAALSSSTNQKVCCSAVCDVCHAVFSSESTLAKHHASHWSATGVSEVPSNHPQQLTGADLPLPQAEQLPEEQNVGSILRQVYHTEHNSSEFQRSSEYQQQHQELMHHQQQPLANKLSSSDGIFMDYPHPSFDSFLYFNA